MKLIHYFLNKTFFNWKHPWYSKYLFRFCNQYVNFCYNDNNFDRNTNGEYWFLKRIIPKVKVVFDVGANSGDYSKSILEINDKVTIHAFEPDTRAFEILKKNIGDKANINNIAMGEKEGEMTLYRHKNKTVFNSLYDIHAEGESGDKINIKVSTVDDYCAKEKINHIDFLKIDVEGYEFPVIKGADIMLQKGAIDMVQFEFSGATVESRAFLNDFLKFFAKYNYTLYKLKPFSLEKVEYYTDMERFSLSNFVAIHNNLSINHISVTKAFYH